MVGTLRRGRALDNKDFMTIEDIYEYLNRTTPIDSIRQGIRDTRLRATKPGRHYLVRRSDLEKFLQEHTNIADEEN